jgi:hypothetical protein
MSFIDALEIMLESPKNRTIYLSRFDGQYLMSTGGNLMFENPEGKLVNTKYPSVGELLSRDWKVMETTI